MADIVCAVQQLHHTYGHGAQAVHVLRGVDVALYGGQITALVGPSGSGKSTLLHMIGLLELPTKGRVRLMGRECSNLGDGARTAMRGQYIGFVYQFHRLLPEFSCLENVMLPLLLQGLSYADAATHAQKMLERVRLGHRLQHRPATLSGGEQQRTAVARALVRRPALIIADEPTGNLDAETADAVFALLLETAREAGVAVLLATHDAKRAQSADKVLTMQQGVTVG